MGTFFWLATEAVAEFPESAHSDGFGVNFNILETNLINLAIVIGVLIYFGRSFLGKILAERKATIAAEIKEAEARQREAAEKLADEQQKLSQAQTQAEKIRADAQTNAQAAKEAILAQAKQDIERIKASASQDTTSSQERAVAQLRQQVAMMALKKAESDATAQLENNPETQRQLVDHSIASLGGRS